MKHWLPIAVSLLAAVPVQAAPIPAWQETLTSRQPGSFPPLRPLKAQYSFGWSAFTAASADFQMNTAKSGLLRMYVKTATSGFVRTLWKMDAEHVSLVQPGTFDPVSLVQTEKYKNKSRTTRLTFEGDRVLRDRETKPAEPNQKKKPKKFEVGPVYDLHGALHFLRSQPLQSGDVYRIVVFPANAPYLAQLSVVGRERVEISGRRQDSIKLDLKLWRIDEDDLKLQPYTKFKRAAIWVGDDQDRLLLKVEGEIFVGAVWCELRSVEFAR
jgi:hypothetical protein